MALERGMKSVVEVACVALPGAAFFFLIIGVFGLQAAIAGLVIFAALAVFIFWTVVKGGTDYEA